MGRRAGRKRATGTRTPSGQLSRAGKPKHDRGALGVRLRYARRLLGPADAARLEQLIIRTPAALAAAGLLDLGKRGMKTPEDAVREEREALFAKASNMQHATERRDPIGRAWHEGLLAGHVVDADDLRDIGREYGWLYWSEYRALGAGAANYSGGGTSNATGAKVIGGSGKDARRFRDLEDRIEHLGHAVRHALHGLVVDDICGELDNPAWLDRLITAARVVRGVAVSGQMPERGDDVILKRAIEALVAMARPEQRRKAKGPLRDRPLWELTDDPSRVTQ